MSLCSQTTAVRHFTERPHARMTVALRKPRHRLFVLAPPTCTRTIRGRTISSGSKQTIVIMTQGSSVQAMRVTFLPAARSSSSSSRCAGGPSRGARFRQTEGSGQGGRPSLRSPLAHPTNRRDQARAPTLLGLHGRRQCAACTCSGIGREMGQAPEVRRTPGGGRGYMEDRHRWLQRGGSCDSRANLL